MSRKIPIISFIFFGFIFSPLLFAKGPILLSSIGTVQYKRVTDDIAILTYTFSIKNDMKNRPLQLCSQNATIGTLKDVTLVSTTCDWGGSTSLLPGATCSVTYKAPIPKLAVANLGPQHFSNQLRITDSLGYTTIYPNFGVTVYSTLNPSAAERIFTSSAGAVSACDVNNTTGNLEACEVTTGGGLPAGTIFGMAVTNDMKWAYLTDFALGKVILCQINTQGNFINCNDAGGYGFSGPSPIVLNPANTRAYIGNFNSTKLTVCTINPTTKKFDVCTNMADGLANVTGLYLGGSTRIYISSQFTGTTHCEIDLATGFTQNCATSSSIGAQEITLNKFGNRIYLANHNSAIRTCEVNPASGNFSNCQFINEEVTGSVFPGISVNFYNNRLYFNGPNNMLRVCNIQTTSGELSACNSITTGGASSTWIQMLPN